MSKAEGDGCNLPLKSTEEEEEEIQEATASLADAKEISADAAVGAVLSELITLKEEQRTAVKVFLSGKDVSVLLLIGFSKR